MYFIFLKGVKNAIPTVYKCIATSTGQVFGRIVNLDEFCIVCGKNLSTVATELL